MEDELTLDELYLLIESDYRRERRHNKMLAAVNGVNLEDDDKNDAFEKIKAKAQAKLAGRSEQEMTFDLIGIKVESD